MGLLKDIKELVGINTGDDEEDIEEMEQEQTSKALSKRQKMEEEVDEFRYRKRKNDYNQLRKYWTKCSSKNNGLLSRCYGN